MSSIVVSDASKWTELATVNVFNRSCPIELLNPQTQAHVFHFEELHREQ